MSETLYVNLTEKQKEILDGIENLIEQAYMAGVSTADIEDTVMCAIEGSYSPRYDKQVVMDCTQPEEMSRLYVKQPAIGSKK